MARTVKATNRIPKEPPRAQYSSVLIAILGGLYICTHHRDARTTTTVYTLKAAVRDLAEGGFVIDLQSSADHPGIVGIANNAPEQNGQIDYSDATLDPSRLRADPEQYWKDFKRVAGEQAEGPYMRPAFACAAMVAMYYVIRGVRVGRRIDDAILWSDGTQDQIDPAR